MSAASQRRIVNVRARLRVRVRDVVASHGAFVAVLVLGCALRAVLMPLWHGEDFTVWGLASAATLRGVNVYAHHPGYPGGPFAYFPPFLYLELPFRWAAEHSAVPFLVLGKLPIAGADIAVTTLIYRALLEAGAGGRRAAGGAALFFLNPLVLYNSALYGRFDSVGCALLLAFTTRAATGPVTTRARVYYALAVTVKTFPVFVLAVAARAAGRRAATLLLTVAAVTVTVSLPYLAAPLPFLRDVGYDIAKVPGGLSWWTCLASVTDHRLAAIIGSAGLLTFVVGAASISRRTDDVTAAVAATLVLFLLSTKLVLEQYLTWPLPWLIILGSRRPASKPALGLVGCYTTLAALDNESVHPLGRDSMALAVVLAAANIGYLVTTMRSTTSDAETRQVEVDPPPISRP